MVGRASQLNLLIDSVIEATFLKTWHFQEVAART